MTNKAVLVTGATGFIGRNLVNYLLYNDFSVYILTRKSSQKVGFGKNVIIIHGDLPGQIKIPSEIKTIYHCAGVWHRAESTSQREQMRSVNVHGTKNIVEAALSQGCRLIHLSTALVVGATKQKIISEDTECHPRDSYEQGKLEGENLVREGIAKGLKAQILRPSYVFGAGRAPEDDPFYQLVVSIKKGRYRNVKGGKGLYNIVHVDEVVRAMLLLDNDCVPNGGTYFINTPISFKRLSTIVKTVITDRTCEVPSIPYAVLFSATILLSALAVVTGKSMPLTFSRLKSLTNEKVYSQKRLKDTEVYRPLHNIEEYVVQTCKNYMQNGMI